MIQNLRANDTNIFGQTPWGQTRIDHLQLVKSTYISGTIMFRRMLKLNSQKLDKDLIVKKSELFSFFYNACSFIRKNLVTHFEYFVYIGSRKKKFFL